MQYLNYNPLHISFRTLVAVAVLLIAGACSDNPDSDTPDTPSKAPGRISFTLSTAELTPASRSMTYSGPDLSINEGDLVGSVITQTDDNGEEYYVSTAIWEYHPDGLTLLRSHMRGWSLNLNPLENPIIHRVNDVESGPESYEIMTDDYDLNFYFYYPCIDEMAWEEIQYDYFTKDGSSWVTNIKKVPFPNVNETDEWTTTVSVTAPDDLFQIYFLNGTPYEYTFASEGHNFQTYNDFPFAPMLDFRSDDINDTRRLDNSNFLYGAVTSYKGNPISAENCGVMNVTLRPMLATLELAFAENPSEVYLEPTMDSNWKYNMVRRQYFDFTKGRFVRNELADVSQGGSEVIDKVTPYKTKVYPMYMGTRPETVAGETKDYHIYRLIMMPQTAVSCNIVMNINGQTLTLENLQRNPKLATLEAGNYYKLRFQKAVYDENSGWHLQIDDWEDGGGSFLERP